MIDLQPGMGVEVTDGDRYVSMLLDWMIDQLQQLESTMERFDADDQNDEQLFFALARAVLPNREEITGMMGVIAGRWEVNDDGFFAASVQEMPVP